MQLWVHFWFYTRVSTSPNSVTFFYDFFYDFISNEKKNSLNVNVFQIEEEEEEEEEEEKKFKSMNYRL